MCSRTPQVGVLGRGAFGLAMLLEDPSSSRKVVAKCMRIDATIDDIALKRMQEEVRILQRFTHANVIGYLGTFFASGSMHILMEYAPGGTVKKQIAAAKRSRVPLDGPRVCRWARELAFGLESIHSHGVVHRDLKPDNILLGSGDAIKIADFGWSITLAPTRLAKTFAGTPYYMAPEILQHKQYGMPADLWSVGVVLHELLTLVRPFSAGSLEELEAVVLQQRVTLEPRLSATSHARELCALATSDFLLRVDTLKRMTLTELIAALDMVPEASGANDPPSASSDDAPTRTREADSLPPTGVLPSQVHHERSTASTLAYGW